jgi:hypothetical protein
MVVLILIEFLKTKIFRHENFYFKKKAKYYQKKSKKKQEKNEEGKMST